MYSDEELLDDLFEVGNDVDGRLTKNKYKKYGAFSPDTIVNRFGSWTEALSTVGVKPGQPGQEQQIPDEAIVDDLKRLDAEHGSVTQEVYREHGEFALQTVIDRFDSWSNAKDEADVSNSNVKATIDEIVAELEKGKTMKAVAEHFGYASLSSISRKLDKNNASIRNKLSRQPSGGRTLSLKADDLDEAGIDPDSEIYFDKEISDGVICLTLHEDRVNT